jgi:hypothetical protein
LGCGTQDGRRNPGVRILVITSYPSAWQALADITTKTMAEYCTRHGYDLHIDRSDLRDAWFNACTGQRELLGIKGFIKLDLLLHFLPKYDVVCWLDADLLITNYEVKIESKMVLVPDTAHITIPADWNGHNSTVIIARNTGLVRRYFWACNNTGRKRFLKDDWVEMEAMRYFAQTPPYDKILAYRSVKELCPVLGKEYEPQVPSWVSQSYSWEPGDWTLHLSALSLDRRIELAREYAEKNPCT